MAPRAGLARRIAASLYEALLLAALAVAIGFALLPLTGAGAAPPAGAALALPSPAARAGLFASVFLACGVYCVAFWSEGRQSLPMQAWRLSLVTAAGAQVGAARAALRYLGGWIGPALALAAYAALRPSGHARWGLTLLALNYAWALVDPRRRFLHDRLAGTDLVRADRPGRPMASKAAA